MRRPALGNLDLQILKMNTNQKGKLTELKVLTYITELGYSVSIPFGDKDRYDQIWDINGKLIKVQIKTSHWKNEDKTALLFKCKSTCNGKDHKYSSDEIDYFATYWNNECYLIPVSECSTEKTLWFSIPKNNCSKCAMAENYIAKEVLKQI